MRRDSFHRLGYVAQGMRCALQCGRPPLAVPVALFGLATRQTKSPCALVASTNDKPSARVRIRESIKKRGHSNEHPRFLARCKGFEPLTYWSVASHSIQLS